jgi:hypothetical protein
MKHSGHAEEITRRFRELVEEAGDNLSASHYDELALLIEAGIDAALVDKLEKMAAKVEKFSHDIRHDAEFFD